MIEWHTSICILVLIQSSFRIFPAKLGNAREVAIIKSHFNFFFPAETCGRYGGVPNTDHGYLGDERHKSGLFVALIFHHDCRPVQVKITVFMVIFAQCNFTLSTFANSFAHVLNCFDTVVFKKI